MIMYEDMFPARLMQLRLQKGISARDMSLSIGQNPGYINSIERGKALPSLAVFFFICDYLNISPKDFFSVDKENPKEFQTIISSLDKLNTKQIQAILSLIDAFTK